MGRAGNPGRDAAIAALSRVAASLAARAEIGRMRMFGSEALSVKGKMFAFAANSGDLVVKLPEGRVAELGLAPMVMRGRPMREWASVPPGDEGRWLGLAAEALDYVDSITASAKPA